MQALLLDGWLACVATALGALPAHVLHVAVGDARRATVIAIGGCVAAGLMVAASALLVVDAIDASTHIELLSFAGGACASVLSVRLLTAIAAAASVVGDADDATGKRRSGAAASVRSILLLAALATDALAEGVAMGVAARRDELDTEPGARRSLPLMALMLCAHNVPEGMAAASAWHASRAGNGGEPMRADGSATELIRSALLAMCTSLPQPVGGALALHFLRGASGALPWVQGVAAGALAYVAAVELLPHALPSVGRKAAYGTVLASALGAAALHELTG